MGRLTASPLAPFEGSLVRLRAREADDASRHVRWLNDIEVTRWIRVDYPQSNLAQRWRSDTQPSPAFDRVALAIDTLDGIHIGNCSLSTLDPANRDAQLGILIGESAYRNGGYGTDAMRLLCRLGFEQMNLERIELTVYGDNARAIRVYEKVGFQHEARRRQAHFVDGRYEDVLIMGLVRGDLAS